MPNLDIIREALIELMDELDDVMDGIENEAVTAALTRGEEALGEVEKMQDHAQDKGVVDQNEALLTLLRQLRGVLWENNDLSKPPHIGKFTRWIDLVDSALKGESPEKAHPLNGVHALYYLVKESNWNGAITIPLDPVWMPADSTIAECLVQLQAQATRWKEKTLLIDAGNGRVLDSRVPEEKNEDLA